MTPTSTHAQFPRFVSCLLNAKTQFLRGVGLDCRTGRFLELDARIAALDWINLCQRAHDAYFIFKELDRRVIPETVRTTLNSISEELRKKRPTRPSITPVPTASTKAESESKTTQSETKMAPIGTKLEEYRRGHRQSIN